MMSPSTLSTSLTFAPPLVAFYPADQTLRSSTGVVAVSPRRLKRARLSEAGVPRSNLPTLFVDATGRWDHTQGNNK